MVRKKIYIARKNPPVNIKKYKITYSVPGVNAQLSFETTDTNEKIVRDRFSRLFKGLTIIGVEEVK